ncbi:hypothetical protein Cgig2_016354 [Carnegiea gigantea]|uniref:Uncharacterized protein n=1 Tax=Carnegiea gigantea TaxID=171969 RepID=A0A9Q1JV90_9CARY|nr:hypothetical protein Cgig2_016354 [Carnegiea gigantea]
MKEQGSKPFRFFDMWTTDPQFLQIVRSVWNTPIQGTKMIIISKKLEMMQHPLRKLNKDVFGDVQVQYATARNVLNDIMACIQHQPQNEQLYKAEKSAMVMVHTWKQRLKNWVNLDDTNDKFFHAKLRQRHHLNRIASYQMEDEYMKAPPVAWDFVCKPKKAGAIAKHPCYIATEKFCLWVKWVHGIYIRDQNIWTVASKENVSWYWRKILQIRDKMATGYNHNQWSGFATGDYTICSGLLEKHIRAGNGSGSWQLSSGHPLDLSTICGISMISGYLSIHYPWGKSGRSDANSGLLLKNWCTVSFGKFKDQLQHDLMRVNLLLKKAIEAGIRSGHFIVICGYDSVTDEFEIRDPANSRNYMRVPSKHLDEARKSFGTDEHAPIINQLIIYVLVPIQNLG